MRLETAAWARGMAGEEARAGSRRSGGRQKSRSGSEPRCRVLWSLFWQQASVTLLIKRVLCLLPTAASESPSSAAAYYEKRVVRESQVHRKV